jgi:pimeloyl-ACP methyl ester carboxylesterase
MMRAGAQGAALLRRDVEHGSEACRRHGGATRGAANRVTIIGPMTRSAKGGSMEWLWVLVALFVGVPALAWLGQEKLIFFPQPLLDTAHLPAHAQPLDLVAGDGTRLHGFRVPGARQPAPALIYFGGNAEEISWTLSDRRWPRDWTLVGVNYRGYGRSGGTPGERALVDDALALFDAVAAMPDVDRSRIVVVGRSLGSGVAVRVAAERPVAGAVLISPYDSLVEIGRKHYPWLPVSWLLRHRFDGIASAKAAKAPLLTIVGGDDSIIESARSKALHDAWSGPKSWVSVERAGHNDVGATSRFWDAIAQFLAHR